MTYLSYYLLIYYFVIELWLSPQSNSAESCNMEKDRRGEEKRERSCFTINTRQLASKKRRAKSGRKQEFNYSVWVRKSLVTPFMWKRNVDEKRDVRNIFRPKSKYGFVGKYNYRRSGSIADLQVRISQKHVLKPVIVVIICNRLNYGLKFEITISQNNYSNNNDLLLLILWWTFIPTGSNSWLSVSDRHSLTTNYLQ